MGPVIHKFITFAAALLVLFSSWGWGGVIVIGEDALMVVAAKDDVVNGTEYVDACFFTMPEGNNPRVMNL